MPFFKVSSQHHVAHLILDVSEISLSTHRDQVQKVRITYRSQLPCNIGFIVHDKKSEGILITRTTRLASLDFLVQTQRLMKVLGEICGSGEDIVKKGNIDPTERLKNFSFI